MLRVSEMTVAEQAATVLMPGFWGYSATEPSAGRGRTPTSACTGSTRRSRRSTVHGFGVVLPPAGGDRRRDRRSARLAGELQAAAGDRDGLPALLSIDQEGGDGAAAVGRRGDGPLGVVRRLDR